MKRKKLLSIVMAAVLSLCSLPLTAVKAQKFLEAFPEEGALEKNEMGEFEEVRPEVTPQEGNVKAADKIEEEYNYEELEDGTLEITGYNGNDTELVVPAKINGKRVTRIGGDAFYGSSLRSIELPEGVNGIGSEAFYGCSSLTSIELPASVNEIEHSAFSDCSSLTSIELPASVNGIGEYAFVGCSSLREIIVDGNNVNYKSEDGILYDKNQTELICCPGGKTGDIVIPASVNKIGSSAFSDCSDLTSIELPEGVNEIGGYAFRDCSSLTSIELPESLSAMPKEVVDGNYRGYMPVFSGCSSLKEIIVDGNNANYTSQDGILYEKGQKYLICCPEGKTGDIVIPASVTSIGKGAFRDCSLTSIELPESVNEIGGYAFYGCSSLISIELPEGVNEIGSYVFSDCSSLISIELPESVNEIGYSAFSGCSSLISIELPESLSRIGSYAFYGCSSLISIKLPENLSRIGIFGFSGCSSLTSIELPEGVNEIGKAAFEDCSSLTSIKLPESLSRIVVYAFSGCSNLKEIIVDENNANYTSEEGILYDKNQTELICCPEGKAGDVVIPASVNEIGSEAFSGCSSLTSIELPESVNEIGDYAFSDCSSLREIIVDGNNANYTSQEGILYDKNQTKLICCPEGKAGDIVIPASVNEIGYSAFSGCSRLKSIELPEGVNEIGYFAFSGCSNLKEIIVDGNNANYTSEDGILYDKNQTELICCPEGKAGDIVIPASVNKIESFAFRDCSRLTSIELPASLSRMPMSDVEDKSKYMPAFSGCSSLKEIIVDGNNANYTSKDGILYEKNEKYLICCPEGKAGDIVIPESVSRIESLAFSGCSSLTSIELSKGVTRIGSDAFLGCKNLTLLVYKGSYAESYAKRCGLNYRYIDTSNDCSHTFQTTIVKATTRKNGSITKTCTKCGKQTKTTIYAAKTIKLSKTSNTYNGKKQKPTVTIKNSKGKTLKNKKDYTVTYPKTIKNVGIYTVTIKLKENYKGTVKKTFQILPKGTKISKITPKKKGFALKWKKQTLQTTGYQIVYSTNKKFTKKITGTATIGKNKTVSKAVSKLKARKKYYVKIRTYKTIKLNGKSKKLYSAWSKVKTVTTKK